MSKGRNGLLESPDESSYMLRNKTESSSRRRSRIAAASPDDDWGWYVVGGCAFANFLLPGMLGSFGPDVLDGFAGIYEIKSKNGFVSRWISTTFNLTFAVAGSLSCLLCELFSHRAVTFWGGLLASIGMMSSSFADSTTFLYISYGVMVGFGAGLCYPAGMLIVNEYFNERRGLANGLSLVGTTVGSLALPPYIKFLTSSYGYKGGILLVSGMLLNVLACALTYKPLDEPKWRFAAPTTSSSKTSINNAQVTAADSDNNYAAVAVSSSSSSSLTRTAAALDDDDDSRENAICTIRQRLFGGGGRPPATAEFFAVSATNAMCHFACAAFAAIAVAPWRAATLLQLTAGDAAGRLIAPAVSDLLSSLSGGSSSVVYLNAVAMAAGGAVLLSAAAAIERADDPSAALQPKPSAAPQRPSPPYVPLVAFALASGAVVGLEPLVAVHALGGRERLAGSCSVTLLGKGAAQLAVDLLFPPRPPFAAFALYALGSCLVAAAAAWTVAFLFRCHRVVQHGCSRYVRTA